MTARDQGNKLHESLGIRTSALSVLAALPPLRDMSQATFEALFCRPGSPVFVSSTMLVVVVATHHRLGIPFFFERAPVYLSQLPAKPRMLFKKLLQLWRRSQILESCYWPIGMPVLKGSRRRLFGLYFFSRLFCSGLGRAIYLV